MLIQLGDVDTVVIQERGHRRNDARTIRTGHKQTRSCFGLDTHISLGPAQGRAFQPLDAFSATARSYSCALTASTSSGNHGPLALKASAATRLASSVSTTRFSAFTRCSATRKRFCP